MTRAEMIALVRATHHSLSVDPPKDDEGMIAMVVDNWLVPVRDAERERCARVCEERSERHKETGEREAEFEAFDCAAAIRRGEGGSTPPPPST